jgi:hypothetical protein
VPRNHFSQNSERATRCVGCCTILLKPHIFCSVLIQSSNFGRRKISSIAQYRSEVTVTVTKVRAPYTKLKNCTPNSNLGVWSVGEVSEGYCETRTGNVVCWLSLEAGNVVPRRTAILNELLNNKSAVLTLASHGMN